MNQIDNINVEYLDWLKHFVVQEDYYTKRYNKLFELLQNIDFVYCLPMDENREQDGIDLRLRFINEHNYRQENIDSLEQPCSVLEMMVALSIKCEENFAWDPSQGDRTGVWFWKMISNIGLTGHIDDDTFDSAFIERKISKCLERDYQPNGKGGFFIVPHCDEDLRDADIWKQAMWYLDTVLFEKEDE